MLERLLSASISMADRDKAAKALREAHDRVVRTGAERLAKLHGAESLVAEEEHVRALAEFHALAVDTLQFAKL